jgi:Flp pilus assembly protein TadD
VLLFAVVLLALAVYARVAGFEFVFDDPIFILDNPFVHSAENIPHFFTEPVWSGISVAQKTYYRPVFLLWVLCNWLLFGAHPAGWHCAALLLHLANIVLVYFLALRLARSPLAAAVAAALFGLHPIQAEAVSWICCTNDLLACFLVLASFLSYLRAGDAEGKASGRSRLWRFAAILLFAAGALSKEPALVLPLLIFLHEGLGGPAFRRAPASHPVGPLLRASLRESLPFFVAAGIYLFARVNALGSLLGQLRPAINRSTEFLTLPSVLIAYLAHVLWPVGLSAFYDVPYQESCSFTGVLLPLLTLLSTVALVTWALRRSPAGQFAVAWTILFLMPALHLAVFPRGEVVHDRYLYVSMAGLGLLGGIGFAAASRLLEVSPGRAPYTIRVVAFALTAALALAAFHQAGFWRNNFDLFARSIAIAPQNGIATGNLGIEYMKAGDPEKASPLLRRAAALNPDIWKATRQVAYDHYRAGSYLQAEHALNVALAIHPDDAFSHLLLGLTYLKTGRPDQAIAEGRRTLSLSPYEPGMHFGVGTILEETGNLAAAREEFRAELALRPDHQPSLQKLQEVEQRLAQSPPQK